MNLIARGNKTGWSAQALYGLYLGLFLSLLMVPALSNAAALSTVFSFDLHLTSAGVVEGDGSNQGYLFGTTSDTALTYGGAIYKVSMLGGEPQTIYQLQSTDGYAPQATLLRSAYDHYLYGTTHYGPRAGSTQTSGSGTVFRVAQDGSGFTTLHTFGFTTGTHPVTGNSINVDGIYPDQALIEDSSYLYGVTTTGGVNGAGTVFSVRKSDGLFRVLRHFAAVDSTGANAGGEGTQPSSSLTLGSDGRLYGVTYAGGSNLKTSSSASSVGTGTIYSLQTDGSGFESLYSFDALSSGATNTSGAQPNGSLLEISPSVFIGTTTSGGDPTDGTGSGYGTVYRFNADTLDFSTIYAFDSTNGATPKGDLIDDQTTGLIYGVVSAGTSSTYGGLFSIDPASGDFTLEHTMAFAEGNTLTGSLLLGSDGDLYGTATYGGACTSYSSSGYGDVFRYSITTGGSSSGYSSCTAAASSGGGAMSLTWLSCLSLLGLAPLVRRRQFTLTR